MKKITLLLAALLLAAFNYAAQAQVAKSAACTPGNLATEAASYLTTVTNLTVTGTIDARDFKTMRDAMPLLAVVDLSGTTVVAYTGTAGTNGATSTVYPENGIPVGAFCIPSSSASKTSLRSFIYPALVTSIGDYAFAYCSGFTGSLTIPASVTIIGERAFFYCDGLKGSLTIPSKVTIIGNGAFGHCPGFIGLLTIPASVTTIGNGAFAQCYGFTGTLIIPASVTTIDGSAFYYCIGLTGPLTIPSSVTTIGNGAFQGCTGFTGSLTIPSSVTTIGNNAFKECSGFKGSLTIPSSVKTIGSQAFSDCWGFTGSLTIPSSVTTIGAYAFVNCPGFKGSLTIPSKVTTIGDFAFYHCTGLTSIYASVITPIDVFAIKSIFGDVNKSIPLHVPVGSKSKYAAADQWKDFTNIVDDIVPTSLNEVLSNSIAIFPNPATTAITISELGSLVSEKIVTLSVVDVLGSTLLVKDIEPSLNILTLDVTTFKNGIYLMVIQTSNGSVVKRFAKE